MTVSLIRLAFDSGWSHGDPGDGRLRFDSPKIGKASTLCVNARCAQETMLDQLVPQWGIGDVLVIERAALDKNRIVAWIIGPIAHGGSYFRIPVKVRSVSGSFAAHDELLLHHHLSVTETDEPEQRVADQSSRPITAAIAPPVPQRSLPPAPPMVPVTFQPLAPLAPIALTNAADRQAPQSGPHTPPAAPLAPTALTNSEAPPMADELADLRSENACLQDIISHLLADPTEVYAVEANQ